MLYDSTGSRQIVAGKYNSRARRRAVQDNIPMSHFMTAETKKSSLPYPLQSIKVLELSRVLAGPWTGQLLADYGADVIKVERPGTGDDTRAWGPPYAVDEHGNSLPLESAYYLSANRGKRSITLDITSATGQEIIRDLAQQSDILIENHKVGGLAQYGLDYESLHALNPRLIYCSITGFGQTGPLAKRAGYDLMIQAMGGLMSITGEPDSQPGGGPQKVGVAVVDLLTGVYAASAILAALHQRRSTGLGQHVDAALFDVQLAMLANQGSNYLVGGMVPQRIGTAHPNIVPYQRFATKDGFLVLAVGTENQFATVCKIIGLPDLPQEPRFSNNASRVTHRNELVPIFEKAFLQRGTDDWIQLLELANIPCAPVRDLEEVFRDPQVEARGMILELQHPDAGQVRTVAQPMKFSAASAQNTKVPPRLGEHAEEILRELGYEQSKIAKILNP
jgi:crotonobetainyl-CoA:carnitine CoA-transferase CaiB-like acyl-CoA transferase